MRSTVPQGRFAWRVTGVCAVIWLADAFLTLIGLVFPVGAYLGVGGAFATLAWFVARDLDSPRAWRAALLGGLFVASLAVWPWSGRKAFFRDVGELEVGMQRAHARAHMSSHSMRHPFEASAPFLANVDPRIDLWSRGDCSFDHVLVHYDEADRVRSIERIVD